MGTKNYLFNQTVTLIEVFNKDKKGNYSERNNHYIDLLEKSLSLSIGQQFEIPSRYLEGTSNQDYYYGKDNTNHAFTKTSSNVKDSIIVNLFICLSVTLEDRAIMVFENKNGNLCLVATKKSIFADTLYIRDKEFNTTITVHSDLQNSDEKITFKKGKRLFNDDDKNALITVFNTMLGVNYNKPLVIVNKK